MRGLVTSRSMFAHLDDGVHRAVQQGPHDRVVVLLGDRAVALQRGVSPVVEGKVLRRMLCADAEAVAHRSIETDPHAVTTASTS